MKWIKNNWFSLLTVVVLAGFVSYNTYEMENLSSQIKAIEVYDSTPVVIQEVEPEQTEIVYTESEQIEDIEAKLVANGEKAKVQTRTVTVTKEVPVVSQKEETKTQKSSYQPISTRYVAVPSTYKSPTPAPTVTPTPAPTVTPTPVPEPEDTRKYVNMSIDCHSALEVGSEELKSYLPSDGIILSNTDVQVIPGDTVWSIFNRVASAKGIPSDAGPSVYGVYIKSIDNLACGSIGGYSGWTYYINGELGPVAADQLEVHEGDFINWKYTCGW